jgi:hypothetical protein
MSCFNFCCSGTDQLKQKICVHVQNGLYKNYNGEMEC